jgi:GNAT superfamily N-acetyltransferase
MQEVHCLYFGRSSKIETMYFRRADRHVDIDAFETLMLDANQIFQQSFFSQGVGRSFSRGECRGCILIVGYAITALPLSAALLYRDQNPTNLVQEYNVQSFCAHPQRRGGGTQLMQEIVRHAQGEPDGISRIWLTVEQPHPRVDGTDGTGDFYQQCGFAMVPQMRRYTPDGIYEYDMERILNPVSARLGPQLCNSNPEKSTTRHD